MHKLINVPDVNSRLAIAGRYDRESNTFIIYSCDSNDGPNRSNLKTIMCEINKGTDDGIARNIALAITSARNQGFEMGKANIRRALGIKY